MSNWKTRLATEHRELKDRTEKLVLFCETPEFGALSPKDQALLLEQRDLQVKLNAVVAQRVARIPDVVGQTLGQHRVRYAFNPSKYGLVDEIKQLSADLIDLCEEHKEKDPRICAMAQTHYELAAMLAVKLVTT